MKLKRFSIGTLGLLAVSGFAWSCSSKSDDCNANLNCAPYGGGAIGTSGSSGAASSSGNSGKGGGGTGAGAGASGTSGEGGNDSSAGSGGATPPVCDGTLSPDADACVISDEYGVFVAPMGDEGSADGSQSHPFPTLTSALARLSTLKKRV